MSDLTKRTNTDLMQRNWTILTRKESLLTSMTFKMYLSITIKLGKSLRPMLEHGKTTRKTTGDNGTTEF